MTEKGFNAENELSFVTVKILQRLQRILLGKTEPSNWQQIQGVKITILSANWQLFRLKGLPKHCNFILPTQNIQVLLVCDENKEINVAHLMMKYRFVFSCE